jgi:hypothetical protein
MSIRHIFRVTGSTTVEDDSSVFNRKRKKLDVIIRKWERPFYERNYPNTMDWQSMYIFAVSDATEWSGAFSSERVNELRLGEVGCKRRYYINGTPVDVVIEYLGSEDAIPPIPDNIILGVN